MATQKLSQGMYCINLIFLPSLIQQKRKTLVAFRFFYAHFVISKKQNHKTCNFISQYLHQESELSHILKNHPL